MGIKINGTTWDISGLSENAATITTEYAGPPTVQFIYVENYDDNTSSSDKTEDILATKSGASYVAVSTKLTNNVTLTFTGVSNVLFSMTSVTGLSGSDVTDGKTVAKGKSGNVEATFSSGCSAIVYNGRGEAAEMVTNSAINLAGSSGSYFKATLASPLAEGDIITSSNTSGSFYVYHAASNSNSQTIPYTIPANSDFIGKKEIYVYKYNQNSFSTFTVTRPKTINSQTLGGVKEGETTLAETTDYTVSENTITLTEAHKAAVAPTNIKLINHITYDDNTSENQDVDVTLTMNGEYHEGTATIGTITYTVKVPVDATTPAAELSSSNGSINLTESWKTGSVNFTLTGVNLTNGTYNVTADVEGATINPTSFTVADGSVSQAFTITSTATTAATTVFTIGEAGMGVTPLTYTLTYSQSSPKRTLSQTNVTGATTWDWTKSGGASIQLDENTIPANGAEFLLAELPEITNDATFNSQALKVVCQWPNRGTDYYFQGNSVKFTTTVPGTVQVWFSNTSNRDDSPQNRRFLYVNGTNSNVYTLNQTFTNTAAMSVGAGEVVINAFTGEETPAVTMVRINKIVFTAFKTITLNAKGYTTYSDREDFTVSGANVKAYKMALDTENETLAGTEVTSAIPAGAGILLKGDANGEVTITYTDGATALEGNSLKGTTQADGTLVTKGSNTYYVLSGNTFMTYTGDAFAANKAYFEVEGSSSARSFSIVFDGETTGIADISSKTDAVSGEYFDLQGRRVAQPTKGLYIVNGKKMVVK